MSSRSASRYIPLTKNLKKTNPYIQQLYKDYKDWTFDQQAALKLKGCWREQAFGKKKVALNLEIGPGNGKHFAKLCLNSPKDCFLAIELRYKALIQSIRRVRHNKSENGKLIRFNARQIHQLFEKQELNNVYIHFPDPWLKKRRQKKHQLINQEFCNQLYSLQKKGSLLELKTDCKEYFLLMLEQFKHSGYVLKQHTFDVYEDKTLALKKPALKNPTLKPPTSKNQLSQFELLFLQKNIPIKQAIFIKA